MAKAETKATQTHVQAEEELVSVVIPAYNRADLLPFCLDSLLTQDHPRVEIIVVDDGSTDGTADVARGYPVELIELEHNLGAAQARNAGARAAKGYYLAFLDSDCVAPPDWISTMVRLLSEKPQYVGVNGTYAGDKSGTFAAEFAFRLNRFKESKSPEGIETCNTSTFMCERQALLDAGGFPRFFTKGGREIRGREDASLACEITRVSGRRILMAPEVAVSQFFRRTWPEFLRQQVTYSFCLGMHGVSSRERVWAAGESSFDRTGTVLQLSSLAFAAACAPLSVVVPPAALGVVAGTLGFLVPQREFIREYEGIKPKLGAVCGLTATSITWGVAGVSGIVTGLALLRKRP